MTSTTLVAGCRIKHFSINNPFYFFPNEAWHWENFTEVWNSCNFLQLYVNTIILMALRVLFAFPGPAMIIFR